jgi:WG containing repeat
MEKILFTLLVGLCFSQTYAQNVLVMNKNENAAGGSEYVLIAPDGKVVKTLSDVVVETKIVEGLVRAKDKKTKKTGFIDAKTGDWAIKPEFDSNIEFRDLMEGTVVLQREINDKKEFAAIDKTGKFIVPFSTTELRDCQDGVFVTLRPVKNNPDAVEYGVLDKTGKLIAPYSERTIYGFKEGLSACQDDKGRVGYIDKKGVWVVKPQFEYAKEFSDGMAAVTMESFQKPFYGFIDRTGKLVIKYGFPSVDGFKDGLANVNVNVLGSDDTEAIIIDKTGKKLISAGYPVIQTYSEGLAAVGDRFKGYGFIDKTGKLVIPIGHKQANSDNEFEFSEGLCLTNKGYIDPTGKMVISFANYAGVQDGTSFKNGIAVINVLKNKESAAFNATVIDKTGKILWQSELMK